MAASKFDRVKDFYDRGLWRRSRVHDAVVKDWITAAQYEEITGEAFKEE